MATVIAQPLASQSHFELEIQGLAAGTVSVAGFDSEDHVLSGDYRLRIQVIAATNLELPRVLGAQAGLSMRWSGDLCRIRGVISHVSAAGSTPQGPAYVLVLSSPLWGLKQARHNRVYLNKTVLDIVRELLASNEWQAQDFDLQAKGSYPAREFVAQYEESDYDFLSRQLAYHGLFFAFRHAADRTQLVIHDELDALAELLGAVPLPYQVQTGQSRTSETVFALRRRLELKTSHVCLKDYNDQAPERLLHLSEHCAGALSARGEDYRYGEHYGDDEEGGRIARIRQQAIEWQRDTIVAESDCRGLQPGMRLSLTRHPEAALNGDWLVVEVEHHGDQAAGFAYGDKPKGLTYSNRLLLIRAGTPYRSAYEPWRRQIYGSFNAKIEGDGGDYAYLDEHGRYRLRLPWDLGDAASGQASHPVRLMQPYGGERYGLHFPLHHGAEVAVSFVNGDIDRPFILGALSNPAQPSPVTAATDFLVKAAENVRLTAESADIDLRAGKDMIVQTGADLSVEVRTGDATVLVDQGKFELEAASAITFKGQGGGVIHIGQGAGAIEISEDGDFTVNAPKVEINAASIAIKGQTISNN